MKSDKFKKLTDEQLAAFIDGNTSESENETVLDSIQTKKDLETLAMSITAKNIAEETDDELDDMPDVSKLSCETVKLQPFESLPMAGFLGNNPNDSENPDEVEKKK